MGTRTKMVAGAAGLIARRGVSATSVREVVRATGTPRGSIAHHFPGGKRQLIEEAIEFAGQAMGELLETALHEHGAVKGMGVFIDFWRRNLEKSGFEAGCPVLAVCLEHPGGDDVESDTVALAEEQMRLLQLADAVFADWQRVIADALRREGLAKARAQRLATLIVTAMEGTIALCRASRSTRALDEVKAELTSLVKSAIGAPPVKSAHS